MKAVIVDIKGKYAAALDETGNVARIPNANYVLGQKIELHEVKAVPGSTVMKRVGAIAAAAVLVIGAGTGTAYALPYGTVSLDGEAEIEYTINCFDMVLDVQALNSDAETLLSGIDKKELRHHRIDKAISATLEYMDTGDEQGEEEFSVSAKTRSDAHSGRLERQIEQTLVDEGKRRPGPKQEAPQGEPTRPDESALPQDREHGAAPESMPGNAEIGIRPEGEAQRDAEARPETEARPEGEVPPAFNENRPIPDEAENRPAFEKEMMPDFQGAPEGEMPPGGMPGGTESGKGPAGPGGAGNPGMRPEN